MCVFPPRFICHFHKYWKLWRHVGQNSCSGRKFLEKGMRKSDRGLVWTVSADVLTWLYLHRQVRDESVSIKQCPGSSCWAVFVMIARLTRSLTHTDSGSWGAVWAATGSYADTRSTNNISRISGAILHCLNIVYVYYYAFMYSCLSYVTIQYKWINLGFILVSFSFTAYQHVTSVLSYLVLSRKRHEDKMCGGDGGEPDSSVSVHCQYEQRRPQVSCKAVHYSTCYYVIFGIKASF